MIRRLDIDEIDVLREMRLAALADAPAAFGSTYADARAYTDDAWRAWLSTDRPNTFIWEADGSAQGIVVAACDHDDAAVVHLNAMWVRPGARGSGAADGLVGHVLDWARRHNASIVRLHVTAGNDRAERLYLRHGFVRTGHSEVRERDGLAEIEMEATL